MIDRLNDVPASQQKDRDLKYVFDRLNGITKDAISKQTGNINNLTSTNIATGGITSEAYNLKVSNTLTTPVITKYNTTGAQIQAQFANIQAIQADTIIANNYSTNQINLSAVNIYNWPGRNPQAGVTNPPVTIVIAKQADIYAGQARPEIGVEGTLSTTNQIPFVPIGTGVEVEGNINAVLPLTSGPIATGGQVWVRLHRTSNSTQIALLHVIFNSNNPGKSLITSVSFDTDTTAIQQVGFTAAGDLAITIQPIDACAVYAKYLNCSSATGSGPLSVTQPITNGSGVYIYPEVMSTLIGNGTFTNLTAVNQNITNQLTAQNQIINAGTATLSSLDAATATIRGGSQVLASLVQTVGNINSLSSDNIITNTLEAQSQVIHGGQQTLATLTSQTGNITTLTSNSADIQQQTIGNQTINSGTAILSTQSIANQVISDGTANLQTMSTPNAVITGGAQNLSSMTATTVNGTTANFTDLTQDNLVINKVIFTPQEFDLTPGWYEVTLQNQASSDLTAYDIWEYSASQGQEITQSLLSLVAGSQRAYLDNQGSVLYEDKYYSETVQGVTHQYIHIQTGCHLAITVIGSANTTGTLAITPQTVTQEGWAFTPGFYSDHVKAGDLTVEGSIVTADITMTDLPNTVIDGKTQSAVENMKISAKQGNALVRYTDADTTETNKGLYVAESSLILNPAYGNLLTSTDDGYLVSPPEYDPTTGVISIVTDNGTAKETVETYNSGIISGMVGARAKTVEDSTLSGLIHLEDDAKDITVYNSVIVDEKISGLDASKVEMTDDTTEPGAILHLEDQTISREVFTKDGVNTKFVHKSQFPDARAVEKITVTGRTNPDGGGVVQEIKTTSVNTDLDGTPAEYDHDLYLKGDGFLTLSESVVPTSSLIITLAIQASAGQTTIEVGDQTGVAAGNYFNEGNEKHQITQIQSNVLTISPALIGDHQELTSFTVFNGFKPAIEFGIPEVITSVIGSGIVIPVQNSTADISEAVAIEVEDPDLSIIPSVPVPLAPGAYGYNAVRKNDGSIEIQYNPATANVIPQGGNTNEVLTKASDTDYDLIWQEQGGGGASIYRFEFTSTGVIAVLHGDRTAQFWLHTMAYGATAYVTTTGVYDATDNVTSYNIAQTNINVAMISSQEDVSTSVDYSKIIDMKYAPLVKDIKNSEGNTLLTNGEATIPTTISMAEQDFLALTTRKQMTMYYLTKADGTYSSLVFNVNNIDYVVVNRVI